MSGKGPIRRQILSCICGENAFSPGGANQLIFLISWICIYVYLFSGNTMTAAHGASNSWTSANFLALQKPDTLLPSGPLSLHEAALVVSIHYVGSIVGNLLVPHIVRKFGCKRVMLAVAIPQIVSWIGTQMNLKIRFNVLVFLVDNVAAYHSRSESLLFVRHRYYRRVHWCCSSYFHAVVCVGNIGRQVSTASTHEINLVSDTNDSECFFFLQKPWHIKCFLRSSI